MSVPERSRTWTLRRLLSEVIGSGHRSAEDMTREQARAAMTAILDGEPAETTLGAFWLANRWKSNTPTELSAFTDVLCEQSVTTGVPDANPVDCGANYDGKQSTALLGVAAGLVAAAAGTPIVVHSGDRVPTQEGVAYKHVLDALDVTTDLSPTDSAEMVDAVGFGFYYQPRFNPGVSRLRDRRAEMGVRTFLNTVEPLVNPARASVHLGSFYHLPFAKRIVNTLRQMEARRVDRVLMFQGLEGYDDVRPGSTVVAEWDSDETEIDDFEIQTATHGLTVEREALEVDDLAADSARITEAVLDGDRTDQFADAVVVNAGLRIYARKDADTLGDAVALATETLESGAAGERLAALRAF